MFHVNILALALCYEDTPFRFWPCVPQAYKLLYQHFLSISLRKQQRINKNTV